jgi:hypothetical protein
VRHSANTHDVWKTQDAGATLLGDLTSQGTLSHTGPATIVGLFSVNGDAGITGTLDVDGAFDAKGDVTLGNAAGDTILLKGTTTASANVTLTGTAVLTLPNGSAGTPSLAIGDAGGLFRQAAGVLGFSAGGAERARLSSSGLLMSATTPIILSNNQAYQVLDSGGTARNVVTLTNIDTVTLGYSTSVQTDVEGVIVRIRAGTTTRIRVDSTGIGFFAVSPVGRQSIGSAATDPATTQTLSNNIRTALINLGLCQT